MDIFLPKEFATFPTENITIPVTPEAVRAFYRASPEKRRKLALLVSLQLLESTQAEVTLEELMRAISRKAQARGLTPEILDAILAEET